MRPIRTAERAIGSERKRSTTPAAMSSVSPSPVVSAPKIAVIDDDPGHQVVDVARRRRCRSPRRTRSGTAARRSPAARTGRRRRSAGAGSCAAGGAAITRLSASVSASGEPARAVGHGVGRGAHAASRAVRRLAPGRPVRARNTSSRLGCCSSIGGDRQLPGVEPPQRLGRGARIGHGQPDLAVGGVDARLRRRRRGRPAPRTLARRGARIGEADARGRSPPIVAFSSRGRALRRRSGRGRPPRSAGPAGRPRRGTGW